MRKGFLISLLMALFLFSGAAASAQSLDDIQRDPTCKHCGMDRQQFAHSRTVIEYEDGSTLGGCSIHCAAVDFALSIDKTVKSFKVGDYNSRKLIDADAATWVIGGNKTGVMTKRAKWAFEKKEDAESFVKENGGNITTFDDAIKASFEDMYADTKMIQEKRKARRMKMMEQKEHKHQ